MYFQPDKGKKVLSFGELLLRISLDSQGQWLKDNRMPFYVGGAEANVATALALWEVPSAYMTALPANEMSQQLISYLQQQRIETSRIRLEGNRLGLYYLSQGKDLKNAGVIYDRDCSSFSEMKRTDIDWDRVFENIGWFHFSAICPALSRNMARICLDAVQFARKKEVFVSLDLNFRSKLWKYGKSPIEIMPLLLPHCNLVMGNVWAAHQMLGTAIDPLLLQEAPYPKALLLRQAEETSREIIRKYPACSIVANTFRFDRGAGIHYYTTLYSNGCLKISRTWQKERILDKVGSGDCFMAGLIYGYHNGLSEQETLEFATAAAVDKLDIASDATTSKIEKIMQQLKIHQ